MNSVKIEYNCAVCAKDVSGVCVFHRRLDDARSMSKLHAAVKESNPKDSAATDRVSPQVPLPALVHAALAMFEGMLKYGASNWCVIGVRSTVYVGATLRHVLKWWAGEECDPVTKVHHLGSAIASLSILMDAQYRKKLKDDRPPKLEGVEELFAHASTVMQGLLVLYGDRKPRHFTELDK